VTFQRIFERSILFGRGTDPPSMFLGHRPAYLRIGFQPKENQGLNDPLGIGKMLRAVIFKGFKYLRVETVGALNRFGLLIRLQRARWILGFWHSQLMYTHSQYEPSMTSTWTIAKFYLTFTISFIPYGRMLGFYSGLFRTAFGIASRRRFNGFSTGDSRSIDWSRESFDRRSDRSHRGGRGGIAGNFRVAFLLST
jgi:hypothetical protein